MNPSNELVRRIVNALDDSTHDKEVNPFEFFNHPDLSNWLAEAKDFLNQAQQPE
jgi:hypothetical protein